MAGNPDFCLMIPAFNGGALLDATLRSCVAARLDPARVMVLVVDNKSTDGSFEAAQRLAAEVGRPLYVEQNQANVGRIGNWNRCLERAAALGARYGTFLMVGDELLPEADPLALVGSMDEASVRLALCQYRIVDGATGRSTLVRNFIRGRKEVVPAQRFLDKSLKEGALALGPLQANVYRLDPGHLPRFDDAEPAHTDQRASYRFVGRDERLMLWGTPLMAWKVHPGRFHMGMDTPRRVEGDLALVRSLAAERKLELDVDHVRANLFLLLAKEWAPRPGGPRKIWEMVSLMRRSPGGLPVGRIFLAVWRRVVLRRFLT